MMTERLNANQAADISRAAAALRQGQLVVFPTDTVYGVGAAADLAAAIADLFTVKKRPLSKGIPLLLSDADQLDRVALSVSSPARRLAEHYWPGPLTLIVPRQAHLPANLSPNDGIAVRVPADERARDLIRQAGGAVAATSANISAAAPAQTAAEAWAQLAGQVTFILDGGPAPLAQASTIVDCRTDPPQILRAGPVSSAEIAAVLAKVQSAAD